jgi:hypothetical protein
MVRTKQLTSSKTDDDVVLIGEMAVVWSYSHSRCPVMVVVRK